MRRWARRFSSRLLILTAGAAAAAAAVLTGIRLATGSTAAAAGGIAVACLCTAWGIGLLLLLRRELDTFVDSLCTAIDRMAAGEMPPAGQEEETLLSRIRGRLDRLYAMLRRREQDLDRERGALRTLVSDIAHQTRTPVTNLALLTDALENEALSAEERRAFLRSVRSQAERLNFLMEALVKTSRLETGAVALSPVPAPVYRTLAAAVEEVLPAARQRSVEITVDCPEDLNLPHDVRWTAEAVLNLLDNAVKYTREGGHVKVTAERWEAYTRVDVADDGQGIPEQIQGAVFQRFYRGNAARDTPGVGIGLYLVREIVTRQGGYVRVRSAPAAGRTFSIFLPNR